VISIPKFEAFREQTQTLNNFAIYDLGATPWNLTSGDQPQQLYGIHVSKEFFSLFGATPAMGRTFSSEEDIPNGPHVAVISDALWRDHFGGAMDILGRNIEIGGDPYAVIGVLKAGFQWEPGMDVFLPIQIDPNSPNPGNYLHAAARINPGVSLQQVRAGLQIEANRFRKKYPNEFESKDTFTAETIEDVITRDVRADLYMLLGTVILVLLIACSNVANLLLTRASTRQREIAIRMALGAGRQRIVRQLLTESVLLALLGASLGVIGGQIGLHALFLSNAAKIPRIGVHGEALKMDWQILGFTLIIAVLTGICFGLIPAIQVSGTDLNATLKESGSRTGTGLHQNKTRAMLVVTQISLSLVLLIGAVLLIRTYMAIKNVKPGFDEHGILTMNMSLVGTKLQKTAVVAAIVREGTQRIESLPGVASAATSCCLPLEGSFHLPITVEGRPLTDGPFHGDGSWNSVSPHYFEVFRIPVIRGRVFTEQDSQGSTPVVVINQTLAKKLWPNSDPLGQRITLAKGGGPIFADAPRQIVGVVGDVRDNGLNSDPPAITYVPVVQVPDGLMNLSDQILPMIWAIRTNVAPLSLSKEVQRELREASGLPVGHMRSMEQVVVESAAQSNFNMTLLTIFAGVAFLLAVIGIYGLLDYSVQLNTQEIGIRMALGAGSGDVRNMIVRQGMLLALVGVVLGVSAALGLARFIASLLYGVKAYDPIVFIATAILFLLVGFVATYIPSEKAARIEPGIAIRYE
jgi:putative ABC transport system permease protein